MVRQSPAKVLQMGPVIPIKTLAHLGAHVGKEEGLVYGILTPLGIGCRDLVTPIVTGAEVVMELRAEFFRYALVLDEGGVGPIAVIGAKGGGCDMLRYPVWIPCSTIK